MLMYDCGKSVFQISNAKSKNIISHLNLIISFLGTIFLRTFPESLVRIITAKTLKKLPGYSDFYQKSNISRLATSRYGFFYLVI